MVTYTVQKRPTMKAIPRKFWQIKCKPHSWESPWGLYRDGVLIGTYKTAFDAQSASPEQAEMLS